MTKRTKNKTTKRVNGHECRPEIVQAVDDRIEVAAQRFGRVLPVRLDFKLPANYPEQNDNERFGRMLDSLSQDLRRKGVGKEYIWSREVGIENGREHYHLLMLLNGRKLQSSHSVHKRANELWAKALEIGTADGLVHKAGPASKKKEPRENWLDRNKDDFEANKAELKKWGGYVCKEEQKGEAPKRVREYGCSQLKKGMK